MKTQWILAALLLSTQAVMAAEFEVGRAKVEIPGEGWRTIDMADGGKPYSGGVRDSIPSETKVFIKEDANKRVQTIAVLRASQAGIVNGGLVYSHDCKGTADTYAEGNSGAHTNNYNCTRVWGYYNAGESVEVFVPGLAAKLKDNQLQLPKGSATIISHFANANGSFAEARVLVGLGFVGLEGPAPTEIPKDISPASVVWAQALAKAVRASVGSMSGRLTVPPIQYKDGSVKTASN
jgi:hypothetical protein